MSFIIKQPETEEEYKHYYQLRWKLLRAPWRQPPGSETDDMEDQCFHLMAVDDNATVIAVARLQFNADSEAQIRYMAVSREHQKKGIGGELITALEQQAKSVSCNTIVLHAREAAIGFYQKHGYTITDKSHLLFNEIQHFRMQKAL